MFPIPANATRIRYLESTRTQYINTGIVPDGQTGIELYAWEPDMSGTSKDFYVLGLRDGSGDKRWCIGYSQTSKWYFGYGTFVASNTNGEPIRTSLNFLADGKFLVGTSYSYNLPSLSFSPTNQIRLFGSSGMTEDFSRAPIKIARCRISQGTSIVRDYVPVRVGQVGYLFDRVSGQLFGNAWTGAFVIGPDTFSQGVVPTRMMVMGKRKKLPTTWDYVQSGLVAMWDGIENAGRGRHDASSAVWKDLIGTRDFTVSLTKAEWEKDALYAKNRNAATMDAVPFSSDYTVQFVVKQLYSGTGNSAYIILGLDDTRYYGLLHRPTVSALMCDRAYFTNSATAGYRCLSFSGITNTTASMWADGSVVSANGYNSLDYSSARGNVARIGGSGDSDRPIKIQAIRIYSRALTDAEIAHNYAIDKARFNLP